MGWISGLGFKANTHGFEFSWPLDSSQDNKGSYVSGVGFRSEAVLASLGFDYTWSSVGETPDGWGLYDGDPFWDPIIVHVARRANYGNWTAKGHQGNPKENVGVMYTFPHPVSISSLQSTSKLSSGNSKQAYLMAYYDGEWHREQKKSGGVGTPAATYCPCPLDLYQSKSEYLMSTSKGQITWSTARKKGSGTAKSRSSVSCLS